MYPPAEHTPDAIEAVAASWLARQDRGLTAAEQDAYLEWLCRDEAHAAAIARLKGAWDALNQLSEWRPRHSAQPNPDLLAPRGRRLWRWSALLTAAAALVFAAVVWWPTGASPAVQHQAIIHPGPERMALEDGSVVELNAGAKVEVLFGPQSRMVRLLRGEAHFSVAKDHTRPFIVGADKFAVRAVGTAFSVSLDRAAVSVLVTEGKVRLDETTVDSSGSASGPRELSHLVAGQQAVMSVTASPADGLDAVVRVHEVTPAEIERALSWQGLRLEFVEMPLGDVVNEFNRYNTRKLVVLDVATRGILVGGNFRADNVESFVRLLDSGFGVKAFPRGNEIELRRSH